MTPEEMVATYESALALTQKMLDAARVGQWDALGEAESARAALMAQVAAAGNVNLGEPGLVQRKGDAIRAMLACDPEIRMRLEIDRAELREILDSLFSEKKLLDTYGS